MTMGYKAPSKKAIKDAIKAVKDAGGFEKTGVPDILNFRRNVQETSLFGLESKIPGENIVVGPDAYTSRKWFATLTVDQHGTVRGVR